MISKLSTILVSLVSLAGVATVALQETQSPLGILDETEHTLRPATKDDLDDIVTTVLDAFRPGPIWQYVSIDNEKYWNYTWTCSRKLIGKQWENISNNTLINVISVPQDEDRTDKRSERVVSIAVWNWLRPNDDPQILSAQHLPARHWKCSENLNINATRDEDMGRQFKEKAEPYVRDLMEPQLYLGLLATHPDWDGHDFGATQVKVGLEKAAVARQPVTLIGTPAGWPLYDALGFQSLANITLVKLDGLGTLWYEYMRWDSKATTREELL